MWLQSRVRNYGMKYNINLFDIYVYIYIYSTIGKTICFRRVLPQWSRGSAIVGYLNNLNSVKKNFNHICLSVLFFVFIPCIVVRKVDVWLALLRSSSLYRSFFRALKLVDKTLQMNARDFKDNSTSCFIN